MAEQLSTLRQVHQELDRELAGLRRKPRMTPTEERRSRVIRKQKLRMKDLMGQLESVAVHRRTFTHTTACSVLPSA
jgi:hypothetical protein